MLPPPLCCRGGGGGVDILARGSVLGGVCQLSAIICLENKSDCLCLCCESEPTGTLWFSDYVYASDRVHTTLGSLYPGFKIKNFHLR